MCVQACAALLALVAEISAVAETQGTLNQVHRCPSQKCFSISINTHEYAIETKHACLPIPNSTAACRFLGVKCPSFVFPIGTGSAHCISIEICMNAVRWNENRLTRLEDQVVHTN